MLEEFKIEQPVAYKIVTKLLRQQTISHAYLFETNGYDKSLKFVMQFAKSLLCPHYKSNNVECNECHQCAMIDSNNFPELKIIEADGAWIKKEQLMDLQEEFNKKSLIGKRKVYIIRGAEKLNANSANSILKFLEEPQEGIIAILVTDNKYQLLNTILSRCQIISFNGQVDITKSPDTFSKIGQLLTDSEEEYQSFLEEEKNKEKLEAIIKFAKCYEKNRKKMLLYLYNYWFIYFSDKEAMEKGLIVLLYLYKDVLNLKVGHALEIFVDINFEKELRLVSDQNSISQIIKKINAINQSRQNLLYNANLNLLMDKLILDMEGD